MTTTRLPAEAGVIRGAPPGPGGTGRGFWQSLFLAPASTTSIAMLSTWRCQLCNAICTRRLQPSSGSLKPILACSQRSSWPRGHSAMRWVGGACSPLGQYYSPWPPLSVVWLPPSAGSLLGDAESTSKDSVLSTSLVPLQYPTGQGTQTAVEFAVNSARFQEAFAADLPAEQTALMAATQRPVAKLAFSEPSGMPAWKTLPTWAVVATGDKVAGSDVIRSMAQRAGAKITEVEGSHVIMLSQPQAVTEVILSAVTAIS
jgi:pimeloyl-ACP methyl ester carboxylesterase